MKRRTMLALTASVSIAGCNALDMDDDTLLDETIGDEEPAQFSADAGDDVSITVTVEEFNERDPDEGDAEVDHTAISFQISHDGTPVYAESIDDDDEFTFEKTLEESGTYNTVVTGGSARVTIERI